MRREYKCKQERIMVTPEWIAIVQFADISDEENERRLKLAGEAAAELLLAQEMAHRLDKEQEEAGNL